MCRGEQRRPVVAVAPHADDLAFSIGGAVLGRDRTTALHVVTVFTESAYAPGLAPGTPAAEIGLVRAAEDQRWCRRVGARREALGFGDASVRGFDEVTERSAAPDAVGAAVAGALRDVLLARPDATVLCPAGLGGHVDHRIVRDAVLAVEGRVGPVVLYEDIPYVAELPADAVRATMRAVTDATPWLLPLAEGLSGKLAAACCYASQVRPCDLRAIVDHASAVGEEGKPAERLWPVG